MITIKTSLLTATLWSLPAAAQERLPVIDMHQHAVPVTFWGTPDPPWFSQTPPRARTDAELRQATLAAMRRFNIVKAVFSGPAARVDDWRSAAPEIVLRGSNFAGPCDSALVQRLRSLHGERGYEVMGEISWQFQVIAPDSTAVEACFALAEELDVPMGIHLGLGFPTASTSTKYRAAAGRPLLLEQPLRRHPKVRAYVMHAGWPLIDEMIALMNAYPQVYADVSLINWLIPRAAFHDYLERLINAGFGDRLMYGSDAGVWPGAIELSLDAIEAAPFLTPELRRQLLHDNAARFLRLAETRR
jgi:hypothetical protein